MDTKNTSSAPPIKIEVIKTEVTNEDQNFDIEEIKLELPDYFKVSDENLDYKYNNRYEDSDSYSSGFDRSKPVNVAPLRKVRVLQVFICEICKKSFKTKKELIIHLRVHTNERPYKCTVCEKAFKQPGALSDHIAIHTGTRKHKCEVCNFAFTTSSALKRHVKKIHESSKTYKCVLCTEVFVSMTLLKEHRDNLIKDTGSTEIKDEETGRRIFCCGVCNQSFKKKQNIVKHLSVHANNCNLPFTNNATLKTHINPKHNYVVCSICNAECLNKRAFYIHENDHFRDIKKNTCDYCKKIYESPQEMALHMQTEHVKTKIPFVCTMCLKCFTTEQHLRFHKLYSHVSCYKCLKCFDNEPQLKIHKTLKHSKNLYGCKKCPAVFRTNSRLVFHMYLKHLIVRRFKCKLCKKLFSQYRHLNLHMKMHSKFKNFCKTIKNDEDALSYQCTFCEKEYFNKWYIQNHLVTQHLDTLIRKKRYECDKCDKAFYYRYQLSRHKNVHNSVRSLKCKLCDATYRVQSEFKMHMKKVHEDIKKIHCQICDVVVTGNSQLKKHIINVHKKYFCKNSVCVFKYFNSETELIKHRNLVHNNTRFYCKICNKDFPRNSLRKHNYTIHKKDCANICNLCGLVYFTIQHLNWHKYRKHEESVPLNLIAKIESLKVKCSLCNKVYPTKARLKEHIKTHKEKPKVELLCKICDKVFKKKCGLVFHENKLHNGTKKQTEIFIRKLCNFCDKSFACTDSLKRHIKNKHKNPVTIKEETVES